MYNICLLDELVMRNPSENQSAPRETKKPSWLKSVLSVRSNLARVFAVIGLGAVALMGCEDEMLAVKELKQKAKERMEIKQKYGIDPCEVFAETGDHKSWEKLLCPGNFPKKREIENDESDTPKSPSDPDRDEDDEWETQHSKGKKWKKKGYNVVPDSTPKKRINRSQIKPLSPAVQECIDYGRCKVASLKRGFHRKG